VQVSLLCSDSLVGTVDPFATILEGQTYAIANFTTTQESQTKTAIITAVSQGYTSHQVTITLTPIATNPSQLKIFVGPSQVLADHDSYKQIVIELQNDTGYTALAQISENITVASSDPSVGKIDSYITIPQSQTYALATLNSTYKAGTTTITAVANDLIADHQSISTAGFVPSKLAVYLVPSNLPSDTQSYQAIQVQLQDSQGRPTKDPQADVSVNLISSQPTVGLVSSTLTIPFGKTQATGNLTVTNAPGTTSITAQGSGYQIGQASITTYLIDFSPLQITLTANPTSVNNGYNTAVTAYVMANGAPVTGATVQLTSNNGGTFSTTTATEQGNGYYNASFTAPSFSITTNCTITATGSKTGYITSIGTTQVTVVAAPAPTPTPTPTTTPTPTPTPTPTTTPTPTPTPTPTTTPTPTLTPTVKTGTITLKIEDSQGNPLINTIVSSTIQPTGTQTLFDITNATGYVTFQNATAGSYTFKVIKEGYPSQNETIDYNGHPLILSIILTNSNVNSNVNSNNSSNTLIMIITVVVTIVAIAVISILYIIKRKKSPNLKKLQELQKQMKTQFEN
jgi:hypothetical protein